MVGDLLVGNVLKGADKRLANRSDWLQRLAWNLGVLPARHCLLTIPMRDRVHGPILNKIPITNRTLREPASKFHVLNTTAASHPHSDGETKPMETDMRWLAFLLLGVPLPVIALLYFMGW